MTLASPKQQIKKPSIKILGAYGGKSTNMQLTSLQLSKEVVLDAGNILEGLGNGIRNINHVFISHAHLDHINDIGFLIDSTFENRTEPLKVYGRTKTLDAIEKNIFNWDIWPDFTKINLIGSDLKSVEFVPFELGDTIEVDGCIIKAIPNNHTPSSNGFVIEKENRAILFSSDTYCCDSIWEEINTNPKIKAVIIDVSFPSRMAQLAFDSKHLTPLLLKEELKKLQRDDITVHINHIKPTYKTEVVIEVIKEDLLLNGGLILEAQDVVEF
ncbi:MAG: 3',5'-cyclic-nucleotide phosphodiesterase [Campylobacterales bacterium]|nr:3',5'-cyclic-nucleotide phosphodiesterase [Campylobacterales bacterium]